jgi:hypothetical protein
MLQLLFALKSKVTPLIVNVLVFGTNPDKSWSPVFVPLKLVALIAPVNT